MAGLPANCYTLLYFTLLSECTVNYLNLQKYYKVIAVMKDRKNQCEIVGLRTVFSLFGLCLFLSSYDLMFICQEGALQDFLTDGENHPWIAVVGDVLQFPLDVANYIVKERLHISETVLALPVVRCRRTCLAA